MNADAVGVFLPGLVVFLDLDLPHTVQRHDVKIPHGAVVLRRVAGSDNDEAVRYLVRSEGLVLQELQHGRREGFRDAVDLVQEENALLHVGALDLIIDRGDDFAHRIFRHRDSPSAVFLLRELRQTDRALSGVVRDGIAHQVDAALSGRLFHDRRLADAGRADQEKRALPLHRNHIFACLIPQQIGLHCADNFFFRLFNIQGVSLLYS